MSAYVSAQIVGTPVVRSFVYAGRVNVQFRDSDSTLTLSDTPEALVATLTEALEAVDRVWRASRGEVAL